MKKNTVISLTVFIFLVLLAVGGWFWNHPTLPSWFRPQILTRWFQPQYTGALVCTPEVGYFKLPAVKQEEGSWCWVASAKVFTDFFDMKYQPPPPLHHYEQCRLYDIGQRDPTGAKLECCASSAIQCLNGGWPGMNPNNGFWGVFDLLPTPITYTLRKSAPLTWDEVKDQICPASGDPGRPFIFYSEWNALDGKGQLLTDNNGNPIKFAHTSVVEGYQEDVPTGNELVLVDGHDGSVVYLDYKCKYRHDPDCPIDITPPPWHGGDYYNISPPTGAAPPAPP